jgi:hypothetical protein
MSEQQWSPTVRALLAKAKGDTPSGAARAKMWANISTAVGGGAGGSGGSLSQFQDGAVGPSGRPPSAVSLAGAEAGANGVAGGINAMKMLAIGTLLGGTVAVGLTLAMLRVGAATTASSRPVAGSAICSTCTDAVVSAPAAAKSVRTPKDATENVTIETDGTSPARLKPPARMPSREAPSVTTGRLRSAVAVDRSDSLTREASLLAEGRAALLRGDAKSALRKVLAARSLPVRQLGPEELSVEAQALRALDRASEAFDIERTLRTKYPESALAR